MMERPKPWLPGEAGENGDRRHAPATARNRDAITAQIAPLLPRTGLVLEIASGSGEHVVHFARLFPNLAWQPSDADADALRSIAAWAATEGAHNVAPPAWLDAASPHDWPVARADVILCINMVHISPWEATLGVLRGAARLLPEDGPLYFYGPYLRDDAETAPSNLAFDESLRARDPAWGLRRVEAVRAAAEAEGLLFDRLIEMPANNLSLIFRRGPCPG